MSLSFLRRFAAGAMIGAAGAFTAACGPAGHPAGAGTARRIPAGETARPVIA